MQPLTFSVVIPAYNAAFSIGETVESVLAQSWKGFELLVVDDGSTDDTPRIVRAIADRDSRVRLVAGPRFGLPAGPRNLGMRESKGDYIAFLDADDLWKPDKLANDADYLASDAADFLYSGCDYFVGNTAHIIAQLDPAPIGRPILFRNLIMIQTVCVRRQTYATRRLQFDEDPRLRGIEDYHFILETYFSGLRMARRPGTDVLYRSHSPTSIYPRGNLPLLLRRHVWNLRKIREKYRRPMVEYLSFLALTTAYKSAQWALRRA